MLVQGVHRHAGKGFRNFCSDTSVPGLVFRMLRSAKDAVSLTVVGNSLGVNAIVEGTEAEDINALVWSERSALVLFFSSSK